MLPLFVCFKGQRSELQFRFRVTNWSRSNDSDGGIVKVWRSDSVLFLFQVEGFGSFVEHKEHTDVELKQMTSHIDV